MSKKIVITGGGTGGHVFPAIAIADELRKRGWEILYVGSARGMEAKWVPEKGYPFFTVKTGAIKNQSPLIILKTCFLLVGASTWSIFFLLKEKPMAVVGVGGYVSFPVSFAAFLLRIPLFLQEQNASVGISNRLLGKISSHIFLGFEEGKKDFNPKKCTVTGNPLRESFYLEKVAAYKPDRNFLLVMGGSQGARAINDAILNMMPKLKEAFPNLTVLHQTGKQDHERINAAYKQLQIANVEVHPFLTDMVSQYKKASLVISRSGALSISEIIHFSLPAIFVPYPRKGQNDQTANAYLVEKAGGARVIEQGEGFNDRLWAAVFNCLNPIKLQDMSERYGKLPRKNASVVICDFIEKYVL